MSVRHEPPPDSRANQSRRDGSVAPPRAIQQPHDASAVSETSPAHAARVARHVDRVCLAFEAAWRSLGSARIEEFLADATEPERSVLLRELITLDAEYRRRSGDTPQTGDYTKRFPSLVATELDELLRTEPSSGGPRAGGVALPQARLSPQDAEAGAKRPRPAAPAPRSSDPSGRPLVHCPHCQNTIPLAGDASEEVVCSGCGSSFRVHNVRQTQTLPPRWQNDRFVLLDSVGMGAFGEVWKARDTELDRTVALKVPHASLLNSGEFQQRFSREARAAAQLNHPNIVSIHEVADLDGTPAIVSQFVDGVPLKDLLEVRRLGFREAAELIADIAEALHYAHSMGLVHRDIKPANIMVETETVEGPGKVEGQKAGRRGKPQTRLKPLILDFGLARRDEAEIAMTIDGQIIGTPAYMSPEQAAGKATAVDARSDVYGVGVILYELLCGELPFRGSKMMLLHQVIAEEPRPPRKINDKIPRDLEIVCLKALAKSPERRYQTARDLGDDLRRWQSGEPIKARAVGPVERAVRWARRRPAAAVLMLVMLLIATVGFPFALWLYGQAEAARREQTATLYHQRIALAHNELLNLNMGRMEELLAETPPELRGWEYDYLRRARYEPPTRLTSSDPSLAVLGAQFSPDGMWLVGTGIDLRQRLWDLRSRRDVWDFDGVALLGVAFRPDSRQLATLETDGTLTLWDVPSRRRALSVETGFPPKALREWWLERPLAYSPDGRLLAAAGGENFVHVYEIDGGQRICQWRAPAAVDLLFWRNDDGRLVTVGGDRVNVWDASTHRETLAFTVLKPFEPYWDRSHTPTGHRLVIDGPEGIGVWDTATGRMLLHVPDSVAPMFAVDLSDDGRLLAVGDWNSLTTLWDVESGQPVRELKGSRALIQSCAFLPDASRIATASSDLTVKLWDVASGEELLTFPGDERFVGRLEFSPQNGWLLLGTSAYHSIRLWDATPLEERAVDAGRVLQRQSRPVARVAFNLDGTRLISAGEDGTLREIDAANGRELRRLEAHTKVIRDMGLTPGRDRIITAGLDGALRIWHGTTFEKLLQIPVEQHCWSCAFSPDGNSVALGMQLGLVRLHSAEDARELGALVEHPHDVWALAFSPDGALLATGHWDGAVQVFDVQSRKLLARFGNHVNNVLTLAFSSDSSRLVSAGYDGKTHVWNPRTGEEVLTLSGHSAWPVACCAISPDQRWLANGSCEVRVWDLHTGGEPKQVLRGFPGIVYSLAFSPDGRHMAACGGDRGRGEIWMWDTAGWDDSP